MSSAQLTLNKTHRVQLTNGEVFQGESLVFEKPILKPACFRLDSRLVLANDVRFFKNNHGYFANLNHATSANKDGYAIRIKKGKIDLFEEIDIDVYGGTSLKVAPQVGHNAPAQLAQGDRFQYYSVDDVNLKKACYQNLRLDLAGNAESLRFIKNYRKYQWLQGGLVAGGLSLIAGGYMARAGNPTFTPVMALGVILGTSSYFCQRPKRDCMWQAVEAFNE